MRGVGSSNLPVPTNLLNILYLQENAPPSSFTDSTANNRNNGNVIAIADNVVTSWNPTFTYDPLNRLTGFTTSSYGNTYSYDVWANLTNINSVSGKTGQVLNDTATSKNQLSGHCYDAAGNDTGATPPGCSGPIYSYDAENRMTSGNGASYYYDADGSRVRKVVSGTGTLYWYGAGNVLAESADSGNLNHEFVFAGGKRLARVDGSAIHYYVADHLGTTSVVVSQTGAVEERCWYYPFGGQANCAASLTDQHYKFTSKERDAETGLDYFGARYYGSNLGRWMSADWAAKPEAVPYSKLDNPQSLNLYAYVGNNPLSRADTDGHCWIQSVCDAAKSAFATASLLVHDGNVRENYIATAKGVLKGKGEWSPVRAFAKVTAREAQSGIGRGITAVAEKSGEGVAKGLTGTATNAGVNAVAGELKTLGAVGIVASVGVSVYNVASAPEGEKGRTAAGEGGSLGLSLAGAASGAELGAAIGSVAGPVGTLVGGVVGAAYGGYIAGKAGKELGEQIYDAAEGN